MRKRAGMLGLLLVVVMEAGALAQSSPADTVSGDEPSTAGPAIHWQTDTLDLRADDVTLQLGDQTFSPAGADVTVTEDIDTKSRWYLTARWNEDGHDNTLRLRFRTSNRVWSVVTIEWWVSDLTMPDGDRAWGESRSAATKATRTKVGQTFSGELEPPTKGHLVTCETTEPGVRLAHEIDARLTFEGLSLAVAPPQPTLLHRVLWFVGLDGLDQAAAYVSLLDACEE